MEVLSQKIKKRSQKTFFKTLIGLVFFGALLGILWSFLLSNPKNKKGPQNIIWGKHICTHCGMHIDDQRFAVQFQTKAKETFFFDDVGCAIKYLDQKKNNDLPIEQMYFQHANKNQWLSTQDVEFIFMKDILSPMGFNFGAFKKGEKNQAINFDQLKEKILKSSHSKEKL